jgi:hypothetical protein
MSRSRWGRRNWQWVRLCGNNGGGGDRTRAEIGVDRRLRMVMDVIRGEERVSAGVGRWGIKDGAR